MDMDYYDDEKKSSKNDKKEFEDSGKLQDGCTSSMFKLNADMVPLYSSKYQEYSI